jgi:hypothetical protein
MPIFIINANKCLRKKKRILIGQQIIVV